MQVKIVLLCVEQDSKKVQKELSPPFGLLIAASVLRTHHYQVELYHFVDDAMLRSNLERTCKDAFIVGFTTMTTSNLKAVIKASKIVKEFGCFVYWGGAHATLLPETSLKDDSVDAVLRGEAEANLVGLVQWRLGQIDPDKVPGLCYKDHDSHIVVQPIPPLVPENTLSFHSFDILDMHPYLDREEYFFQKGNKTLTNILPYMTSKGCYKNCAFCYNSIVNKGKWRGYALDNVFHEMDWLIEHYNIEGWYFYDDNFFNDTPRAWTILEKYCMPSFVELDLKRINETFLEKAKAVNVERLYIGAESGSNRMLKKIRKGITTDDIREKVELCASYGVNMELSFIILFPDETPEELQATFDLVEELGSYNNVRIDGPKIYNPYPGTSLFEELLKKGWTCPSTNEEWAKYVRDVSPLEAGFPINDKHIKILTNHGIIK